MTDSDQPEVETETASAAELEAAGQNSMFGDAPPAAVSSGPQSAGQARPQQEGAQPYRVLARKYRPQTFSQLIGQEAMVRTLANAIERGRLAHAFLMTGVRGVGKTSTARLIAKALNCVGPDGQGGATIDPCRQCEPCRAIAEGRHIDVIEMDAASHTGVDDVREIIEAVRYAAVSARYKIYIIDEVHMLSRNAFNALLKTLEEPPAHVKFLFATTEVDKLPVTVLSRTQRFDLRRIPAELLKDHFASICRQEDVAAEVEALAMIAAAAEGSVRDGLSILDQAIAHADMEGDAGQGGVTAGRVRDMLGLADKGAQRALYAAMLEGEPQALLAATRQQYALGVEPLALMRGMLEITHRITVTQIGHSADDAASQEEREALEGWAQRITAGQVHRLWQLLLKGYDEVRTAPDPLVAAQMALLRALHAADMPDPGKLAQTLQEMAGQNLAGQNLAVAAAPASAAPPAGEGGPAANPPSAIVPPPSWPELVDRIDHAGGIHLAARLRMQVRVVELAAQRLVYQIAPGFEDDLGPELRQALLATTGDRWAVELAADTAAQSQPTLVEQAEAAQQAALDKIRSHELVAAALAAYPDAELLDEAEIAEAMPARNTAA